MYSCKKAQHIYCTNCTFCNWIVLTVITQNLLVQVQLHKNTAHLLYKLYSLQMYCTYSNYTKATASCSAAHSTAYLMYKCCRNCTIRTWTALTVIKQKLLLHVQLHSCTEHLLYKYCWNRKLCNRTVLTIIEDKLLPHVQLHNSPAHLMYKLYSLQLKCTYINYTDAAATCSAAQKHSSFTVQIVHSESVLYLQ